MNNNELRELVHLLMMCGIMDKTATESGNVTNEEWLRMKNLIEKYQTEDGINCEPDKSCDLISREALKEAVINNFDNLQAYFPKDFIEEIDNAPTVEPCYQTTSCLDCGNYDKENHNCPRYCEVIKEAINSRPQGEWIENVFVGGFVCSNCNGGYNMLPKTKYCPLCGAQMRGETDDG